jgi:hypothetical protein
MRLSPIGGSVAEVDNMERCKCRLCGRKETPESLLGGCCTRCEKILFDGCLEQVVAP